MGGLFTARGSANLLTRTTAFLAVIFIANSLALGALASSQHQNRSMLDQITPTVPASSTPISAPAAVPAPAAPAVPAAPQVPLAK
jgi:preprotein translocase subunit SecG